MADYSIALGVQPPQIDTARQFAIAADLKRAKTAEQAAALSMEAARRDLSRDAARENALDAYNRRNEAGDKGALNELVKFPDLANHVLTFREKLAGVDRAKFDRNAMQAARDAQRILSIPEGPERDAAFVAELQKDLEAGEISQEVYDQYSRIGADDELLNGIIQQALPLQDLYSRQEKSLGLEKTRAEIDKLRAEAGAEAGGAGGLFTGKSVEAQALNHLISTGQLTKEQAAEIGAGKTITDPATGALIYMTPLGIVRQKAAGGVVVKDQNLTPEEQAGIPLTGPKQMSEGQANAATYADRIANAVPVILENYEAGLSPVQKGLKMVPGGNYLASDAAQKLEQAERDFVNATLRRESGAVISDAEFANAEKQYLPRPGDGQQVLAQKKKNRETVLAAMQRSAGPAYKPVAAVPDDEALEDPLGIRKK